MVVLDSSIQEQAEVQELGFRVHLKKPSSIARHKFFILATGWLRDSNLDDKEESGRIDT